MSRNFTEIAGNPDTRRDAVIRFSIFCIHFEEELRHIAKIEWHFGKHRYGKIPYRYTGIRNTGIKNTGRLKLRLAVSGSEPPGGGRRHGRPCVAFSRWLPLSRGSRCESRAGSKRERLFPAACKKLAALRRQTTGLRKASALPFLFRSISASAGRRADLFPARQRARRCSTG